MMKKRWLPLLLVLLLLLPTGCAARQNTLTVRFLKVGKADAMVLTEGTDALVIDTGESDDGAQVAAALKSAGVRRLTLLLSHLDKDHIGGAAELLTTTTAEITAVYLPDYTEDSDEYAALMAALAQVGCKTVTVTAQQTLTLGDATVLLDPAPTCADGREANDCSIAARVTHGKNVLLFAGDAETVRMKELTDAGLAACTLLKVPHHGGSCDGENAFLTAAAPKYAVICCSEKNPADEEVLEALRAQNTTVFTTDSADIIAVSNGATLTLRAG